MAKRQSKSLREVPFKELQRRWYQKLAQSGFKDIENRDGSLKHPTEPVSGHQRKDIYKMLTDKVRAEQATVAREAVADYYRLAGQFLHDHKFKKKLYKKVWEMHSEGFTIGGIASHLNTSSNKVMIIIRNHKELMLGFKS